MSDCVDPLVAEYPNCNSGDLEDIENGNCDDYNNNEVSRANPSKKLFRQKAM